MNLFRSRYAKLEAYAAAKPEDRTPEMLAAVQDELNAAGVILVPMSETLKSGADLQKHIDELETKATVATKAATTAQDALKELKGQRILPSQKVTSDKKEEGDKNEPTEESEALKAARAEAHKKPYTARVLKMMEQD